MTGIRADQYAAIWASVNLGPHGGHGGWTRNQGAPVCICGATLAAPEGNAA